MLPKSRLKSRNKASMGAHACNPSTREVKAGVSAVIDLSGPQGEPLPPTNKTKINKVVNKLPLSRLPPAPADYFIVVY